MVDGARLYSNHEKFPMRVDGIVNLSFGLAGLQIIFSL